MEVIDELTGRRIDELYCRKVIIDHIPGHLIFGYVVSSTKCIEIIVYNNGSWYRRPALRDRIQDKLIYSNYYGRYASIVDVPQNVLDKITLTMGQGGFPYEFEKHYEAVDSFNIFNNKQVVLKYTPNTLHSYMKYTFGLEFETSQGYIPEDICFRDGLIPLRDGSISGIEYSTVVLEGNKGLCLLKQQLRTLQKYTTFNKECSLHIHFGNFPLDKGAIFRLWKLFRALTPSIESIVPELTFKSNEYKANGKNYCKKLPLMADFDDLYHCLVGKPFFGSFTQPHPKDPRRRAKWNITTRYLAMNLINLLCYNVNKTVEFRFLRPTYNYNKILLWMYIFNAMLKYAEELKDHNRYNSLSFEAILLYAYPNNLANAVLTGINKLRILENNQRQNSDFCGNDFYLENKLFEGNLGY